MATHTAGTAATSSLTAVTWKPGYNSGIATADMATITNAIKRQGVVNPNGKPLIEFGDFSYNGQLFLPGNRGVIKLNFGDVVAVDTNWGWPIVISNEALAAASSPWVFT